MLLRARTQKGPHRTAAILHGEPAAKAQPSLCGNNTYAVTLPPCSPPPNSLSENRHAEREMNPR